MRGISFWAGLAMCVATAVPALAQTPSPEIDAALADPDRPYRDTVRDAARKPAELIAFAGLRPGDKLAELVPMDGYFTRIFARFVGPTGHVYSVVPLRLALPAPISVEPIKGIAAITPNVSAEVIDFAKLTFPEKLDLVWISENYHDGYNLPELVPAKVVEDIFSALKPGGVFLVTDHQAAPGAGTSVTSTLHRIEAAIVIRDAQAAGFRLEASSDLLANPADPHTANVFAPEIRGRTDKFVLKFRKPN